MKHESLVRYLRGALLLGLALAVQSLRLFLPLPLFLSTFLIGSLVHLLLVVSWACCGLPTALLLACLLPCTAYLQGQLALVVLIPVVMAGNCCFCGLVAALDSWGRFRLPGPFRQAALCLMPPLAKSLCMLGAALLALELAAVREEGLRQAVLWAMTLPQFVTGCLGCYMAGKVRRLLDRGAVG